MARIPDEQLERLKQEVSVQRLAEARGIKLKRHGADLIGLCPFHDDHAPSLVISPKNNLWHCHGACQAGGSVIDWVMKAEAAGRLPSFFSCRRRSRETGYGRKTPCRA